MSSDASPMRKRTKEPLFFRRINNGTSFGETVISEYQLELVEKQSGYKFTTNNKSKIMESTDDYKFQNILNQINDVDQEQQQKQHNVNDFESTVFKTLQANRQKMVFKPVTLNMLVAGGQRLGKSTFIDAFLNRDFDIQDIIRPSTDQIKDYHAVRKEGSVKLQLKLIDSPGHGDKLNIQQWYKMLKGYIKSQYKQYKINKNEYLQNMNSQINDTLVHVCLYFISGSQLTENEMVYLKKLCKYVNIIPLLAKGDTYQEEEILVIKKQILQQKVQNNLNWFDCVEALKEYPQKIKLITESKFGPSPPFLVITSCQKTLFSDNQYYYARKYSWGICNIENPDHCEFSLFCNIILGYLSDQLINSTQQFYKDFVQRKKTKKFKQKNIQKINQLNQIVDKKTQFALALPFLGIFLYGLSKFNK